MMRTKRAEKRARMNRRLKRTRPDKGPRLFYNSWWATLLLPALLVVIGGLLALMVFVNVKTLWPTHAAPAVAAATLPILLCVLLGEGCWFGLTCRYFAAVGRGELVLFGAFGRERLRCRLDDVQFDHMKISGGEYIYFLLAKGTTGSTCRFVLTLCADPLELISATQKAQLHAYSNNIQPANTAHVVISRIIEGPSSATTSQLPLRTTQKKLFIAYMLIVALPAFFIDFIQSVLNVFESVNLLADAVLWGMATALLTTIPLLLWFGHDAVERQYTLKFFACMLCVFAAYSMFASYNIGLISLARKERYTVLAQVTVYDHNNTCSRRRNNKRRKLHVQLPKPYTRFNGDWCSRFSIDSEPPATGSHTVYLRESRFARELTFEP